MAHIGSIYITNGGEFTKCIASDHTGFWTGPNYTTIEEAEACQYYHKDLKYSPEGKYFAGGSKQNIDTGTTYMSTHKAETWHMEYYREPLFTLLPQTLTVTVANKPQQKQANSIWDL